MKGPARWIVLAAGAVLVVALFLVLRPSGEGAAPDRTPSGSSSAPSPSPAPDATAQPTQDRTETSTPAPDAREIEIEVDEGRVDGPRTVRLERGERVRLVVSADVADEVHVHGYDLTADVAPGSPAVIAFRADAPGVFEVELESAGVLLVQLQVQA